MRRGRRGVSAILVGAILGLVPVAGGSAAADNTDYCRNEPSDIREQSVSVNLTGSELAFVGVDTDFPPGGGALVCVGVLGESANAGVVPGARFGLVRDCSPSRPVGDCDVDSAALLAVSGVASVSPGIPLAAPTPQSTAWSFVVTTIGIVDGAVDLGSSSGCTATLTSVESYLLGEGSGSWACGVGPLAGADGDLRFVRAASTMLIVLRGDHVAELQCFVNTLPPPGTITSYDFACMGAGGL